jgi:hypothetical protein
MTPVRITIDFTIPEPVTDDLEELENACREFLDEKIGEVDYVIADYGLCFELQDD